ncbi:universal stress protein [Klenkia sp. PcliD-1-E]|uniref:universal stress protein n=1 Tax=Klenkia sp. PcliD-1-E TaxID=2954492 RepID=UPI00209820DC|nr:universal stress protein [Klenkia sp. PcliD-1-E]MCO7221088.1 universal stress protein [Klenkia sp. PcliD-1-E]
MSIVLGYDESPGARRALSLAIDLAGRLDEELVLVFGAAPPGTVGEESGAHAQALAELGGTAVAHAVEAADAAGVRTVVEVLPAKPVDALLAAGDRHDARVIVVGTYGETPLRGAILGSVPHKLLHLSRRPVLCVPAEA